MSEVNDRGGNPDVVAVFHHFKMAQEHMRSFMIGRPNAVLTRKYKQYCSRIDQMTLDMKSEPLFERVVVAGMNQEINSDAMGVFEIQRRIHLLNPTKREFVERVIDGLLNGEEMNIQMEEKVTT